MSMSTTLSKSAPTPAPKPRLSFGDRFNGNGNSTPTTLGNRDRVELSFSGLPPASESPPSFLSNFQSAFSTGSEAIANEASTWAGSDFKKGESARCADFVSHVVESSGVRAPNFSPTVRARDFAEMGTHVAPDQLQAGDVVAFNNTYRHSANDADHTHVGVYVGDGMMVHRPTASMPVELVSLEDYLARPNKAGLPPRSLEGGYRLTDLALDYPRLQ